jgi:hypothetical protein
VAMPNFHRRKIKRRTRKPATSHAAFEIVARGNAKFGVFRALFHSVQKRQNESESENFVTQRKKRQACIQANLPP